MGGMVTDSVHLESGSNSLPAEHIVKACNAYPKLVAVLQTILALDDGDHPDLWHYHIEFDAGRQLLKELGEYLS